MSWSTPSADPLTDLHLAMWRVEMFDEYEAGYLPGMTETTPDQPSEQPDTTETEVEVPAKDTTTVEVNPSTETGGILPENPFDPPTGG